MIKTFFCLVMLLPVLSVKTFAQTKDEKAVAMAVDALRKAMVDADKAALEKLISDDLSYGHSSGVVQTKQEFIEALTSGKSDFVTIELGNQTVKVYDKTAIVRHSLSANTNDNNKPGTVKLVILLVWIKKNGQWKLLARQAVKPAT